MTERTPYHMWSYWRDKDGISYALQHYYPELLKEEPSIQGALTMIEGGKLIIEQTMERLQETEDD